MKKMEKNLLKPSLLIITLIFLLIFSLSAISAAEHTITNTTAGGINNTVDNANSGDTIYLEEGVYRGNNNTNIIISKNLTFIGKSSPDKVIIDGENLQRLFTLYGDLNVTFINITFLNGNTTGNGGAIYSSNPDTALTIINSIFSNNKAIGGGAIYTWSENLVINNSIFKNNYAENGGALLADANSHCNIENSQFINNSCQNAGAGLIFNHDGLINNCQFINNTAGSGGAIFGIGNFTITYTNFTNNSGNRGVAGAILNSGNLTIKYNTFINNHAATVGGAIHCAGNSNLTATSNSFYNNIADIFGGAIYSDAGLNVIVNYNIFCNNSDSVNKTLYNGGDVFIADNNWWGTNNITGLTERVTINNYYLMGMKINNVSQIGDKLIITYYLINNVTNTSEGTENLPQFQAILDYNGKVINISDARNTQNITTTVNALNNNLTLNFCDKELAFETFEVLKGDSNLKIEVIGDKKVNKTVILKATLTNQNNDPLSNKIVSFYVDGVKVGEAITDENGIATLEYTFDKSGNYTVSSDFDGNENYTRTSTNIVVDIKQDQPNPNPNPQPNPNPNNNTNNNNSNNNPNANATMKPTGIPIITLLLVLLSSLGIIIRKK